MANVIKLMTIANLVKATNGSCICNYSIEKGFSSVVTDSRDVQPGSLFVPLVGEKQDGHTFIIPALHAGASVVFIDELHCEGSANLFSTLAKQYSACIIQVENNLKALQDAARYYVNQFPKLIKIGITGSSGKTTTKEIIASILAEKYSVIMNEGNLNSETGLPLSVFKIRSHHEIGVFELGMGRKNEILEITKVLSPHYAIITNIGTAHIGILGSQEAIAEEKKAIFSTFNSSSVGFVHEDEKFLDFLVKETKGTIKKYGKKSLTGFNLVKNLGIDGFLFTYKDKEIHFPLAGIYNVQNALGAIFVAEELSCSPKDIQKGLEPIKPLFGRTEILKNKITIILDCYNANLESMQNAIDFSNSLDWEKNIIFVIGSMLELGKTSLEAHTLICKKIMSSHADYVFLFGKDIVQVAKNIGWGKKQVYMYEDDIENLALKLSSIISTGDLLLVKGSRSMELERILPYVEKNIERVKK